MHFPRRFLLHGVLLVTSTGDPPARARRARGGDGRAWARPRELPAVRRA